MPRPESPVGAAYKQIDERVSSWALHVTEEEIHDVLDDLFRTAYNQGASSQRNNPGREIRLA